MRQNFYWKTLSLFCVTFLIGFFSFDLSHSFFQKQNKSKHSRFVYQQKIKKALKQNEGQEMQCAPVDENLKYHYIQKDSVGYTKKDSPIIKDTPLVKQSDPGKDLTDKELESEEKRVEKIHESSLEKIEKYLKDLKDLKKEMESYKPKPFYDFETHGVIDEKDLLYREKCREIKQRFVD